MRRSRPLPVLLAVAFVLAAPASVPAEPASLEEQIAEFLAQEDPQARLALAFAIVSKEPAPGDVASALEKAWTWDADETKGEVVTWERESPDRVSHTIFAYAPADYTPDKAWPLLVWMHGGVSRDEDGAGEGGARSFQNWANDHGFLVLSPSTQNGAHWWTPNGVALLRGAIADMSRRYRVDASRIAAGGFSDGGSGCFHLLAHDPGPYACFLAFMANPMVTRIYGGPTWSSNVGSRPVYAVNGGQDRLYPSERMKPFMDALQSAGCDLTWTDIADIGHDPSFFPDAWDEIHTFWQEHPREALPRTVSWATSRSKGEGRLGWIEITRLDPDAPASDNVERPVEMELPDMTPRPRLGIVLDNEFEGPGLLIREVQEGTPAAAAGLEVGDVILKAGDLEFESFDDVMQLREFLDGLGDEDGVFVVKRGDETVEIRVRPQVLDQDRAPRPRELGYDKEPGRVEATFQREGLPLANVIDVHTRGVGAIRLYLAAPLVDFEKDLVVQVNGKVRFRGKAPQDVATMLAQAVENGPGAPVYRGFLDLEVAP